MKEYLLGVNTEYLLGVSTENQGWGEHGVPVRGEHGVSRMG